MGYSDHSTEILIEDLEQLMWLAREFRASRDKVESDFRALLTIRSDLGYSGKREVAGENRASLGLWDLEATASDTATAIKNELSRRRVTI